MPDNGELNVTFGIYRSLCCDAEIFIGAGVPFPDCPNHKKLPTEWEHLANTNPARHKLNKAGNINLSKVDKPSVRR